MSEDELVNQYGGYSDQQLIEFISNGVPDYQEVEFKRLLALRRRDHYSHLVKETFLASPPPKPMLVQLQPEQNPSQTSGYTQVKQRIGLKSKSRVFFVILGLVFGCVGLHNYYAGYTGRGTAQLIITLLSFGFGLIITIPWALVEIFVVTADSTGIKMT